MNINFLVEVVHKILSIFSRSKNTSIMYSKTHLKKYQGIGTILDREIRKAEENQWILTR